MGPRLKTHGVVDVCSDPVVPSLLIMIHGALVTDDGAAGLFFFFSLFLAFFRIVLWSSLRRHVVLRRHI